jgi:hypothetical protein
MNTNIIRITKPPKHHLFGFHDLPAWNFNGDKLLCLEVDVINRPPLSEDLAGVGYVFNNEYIKIGSTSSFNFPQGARMQWLHQSDRFIVNNRTTSTFGSDLYDTVLNKKIDRFDFSCHQIHKDCRTTFTINYARLYRLGAYGYAGGIDNSIDKFIPKNDGIVVGDLVTRTSKLLISINDVAKFSENNQKQYIGSHYVTHLLLNPSNTRLAFLHRYPLADGGEITRLMTISVDGSDLRCLASGFLSHFDWKDDNTIFIFGRANNSLDSIRTSPLLSNPIILQSVRLAKKLIRSIIARQGSVSSCFLLITDTPSTEIIKIAQGVIDEDGHPMFCPANREWIINDTYPDEYGIRTLYLYNFQKNIKIDLGKFKNISENPSLFEKDEYFKGVDEEVLKSIGIENLAFTRSGLHCDLHPRWDMQGKKAAFDSIHEGTRQIYVVDIESLNIM